MSKIMSFIKRSKLCSSAVSLLLALSVILSTFAGMNILAGNTNEVWSGEVASGFAGGAGTAKSPYVVSNGEQLALAVTQNKGYYYEMSNDIYLNDVSVSDWKNKVNKEWAVTVMGDGSTAFKGVFNGNGHKVYGLFVNKTYTAPTGDEPDLSVAAGLFPTVAAGAEIYGVGIENSYISLKNDHATADMAYVGYAGLIGYAYSSTSANIYVDRCYLGSDVTLNAAFIGLIATANGNSPKRIVVSNCYTTAQGTAFNGGSVSNNRLMLCSGLNHTPYTLDYTYSTVGLTNSGGSGSSATKYNYSGNWCSGNVGTKVSTSKMKGASAFTNMPGLNADGAFETNENGYPTLKIFNKKAGDVWDGRTTVKPTVGDGSDNDPYIISTPYELAYAVKNPVSGAFYKLAADIYLNDVEKVNWKTGEGIDGYTPNSWFYSTDVGSFNGTLDGEGFMVYGLYYNSSAANVWASAGTGLIPSAASDKSVTVKNLGIDKAYLKGPSAVGAFIGGALKNSSVKISNSFAGADVTLHGNDAGVFVGVNARGYYEVNSCYSLATVTAVANRGLLGDFYGNVSGSHVKNSYNAAGPISTKGAGSLWANNYATEKTGTGIAVIPADDMKGLDALTNANKMPNLGNSFLATTEYPMLLTFYEGPLPDSVYAWDGVSKTAPEQGSGTSADPYLIETGAMLAYAVTDSTSGVYYKLTRDIYLNNVDKINWATGAADEGYTPNKWYTNAAGKFGGHLDGDGYTVYGLYYNDPATAKAWSMAGSALIPAMGEGASLKNIGVDKAYVQHPNGAGGLVATAAGTTYSVNACFVGRDVTLKGYSTGAFVAVSSGVFTISNSYSFATTLQGVEGDASSTYGLFGDVYSKPGTTNLKSSSVINCYNANGPLSTKGATVGTIAAVYVTEGSRGTLRIADNMQGLDVFTLDSKMPDLNKGRMFYATDTYPILKIFAEEATGPVSEDIWSGAVATAFPQGNGSEADPYVITNGAELALAVGQTDGYYYVLNNDIYLNDVSASDWQTSVNNLEWQGDLSFKGHLDGKGHIVYGIWYAPDTAKTTTGLVSDFYGGSIKNIGVRYAQIYAQKYAGLVGSIKGVKNTDSRAISTSFVDDTVTVGYTLDSNSGAGGIVGIIDSLSNGTNVKVTIENCYSKATLTGPDTARLNGIVGTTWNAGYTVKNSYSVGYAPYYGKSNKTVSYLVANGVAPTEVYSGVYATAGTSNENENYILFDRGMAYGVGAKTLLSAFDYENVWDTVDQGTPKLKAFTSISGNDKNPVDSGPVWNGTVAGEFESGSGTEADPYIITKGSQLALAVSQTQGSYYKLANDIYLNDINVKNWQFGENLNRWVTAEGFKGHIDGDGHIINGIWLPKDNTETAAGFIASFSAGSIKNLGVRNSYIYATAYAGGIVGQMLTDDKKTVENCFVDETVTVEYTTSGNYAAGGIIGMMNSLTSRTAVLITIKNCYSKANITAIVSERGNGIIGSNWKSAYIIENCYSVGVPAFYAGNVGTISSLAVSAEGGAGEMTVAEVYKNVYATKVNSKDADKCTVIADQEALWDKGGKTLLKGFDFQNVWATVKKGTPKLKIFADLDGSDIEIGSEDPRYESGIGTKNNPYIIKTEQQLRNLVTATDTKGKFYKLANDIYVNDVSKANWILNSPDTWYEGDAGVFAGTFDGDGHYIYGLYLNKTAGNEFSYVGAGLFPVVNGATVKNVHIRKSYIAGSSTVGSVVGTHRGASTVLACSADDTVTLKGFTVGGLVGGGSSGLKLYYSYFTGTLSGGEGRTNALVGDIWNSDQEVVECYYIGYTPYRASYFPSYSAALYGTEAMGSAKVLTAKQMTGTAAKTNMPDFDWKKIWTVKAGETPHPKVVDKAEFSFVDEGVKGRAWSGKKASKYAGGSGTEEDPYLIETPEQLALLICTGATNGKYYKLIADIKINDTAKADWTETAKQWYTIKNCFRGTFDGDGHVVSGLFYDTVDAPQAGLFPTMGYNGTIKRVGLINSSLVNNSMTNSNFVGGLVGSVQNFGDAEVTTYPTISQCFVDESVYIEGKHAGGLMGGTAETIYIDNCFVTAELLGSLYATGGIATAWKSNKPCYFTNCYFATLDGDTIMENNAAGASVFEGVYVDGKKGRCAVTTLNLKFMQGAIAKEYMPEFDFENVWMIVEGGSPVLRCFRNAAAYSCTREPRKTEMSFASNEGSEVKPLYGFAGDPIDYSLVLEPERYGYEFTGWYVAKNLTLLAKDNIIVWPSNDFIVHAGWIQTGYEQGFDENLDEKFDFNNGVEHYKPGAKGYNPKNIEGGLKSIHTLPDAAVDPIFLVNYEKPMEKGKVYDVNLWIKLVDTAEGTLDFIHADHPQVDSPTTAGYQPIIDLASVRTGEWIQYKATITANAPYLLVRLPAGTEAYLDSFHIVPSGEDGELGDLVGFNPSDIATEPDDKTDGGNLLVIILAVVGGVILLAVIATVVIIFVKKGKKAKA